MTTRVGRIRADAVRSRLLLWGLLLTLLSLPQVHGQAELIPSTKVSDLRREANRRPSDFGLQLRLAAALLRLDIRAARPSQEKARAEEARRILLAVTAKPNAPVAARREVALLHLAERRTKEGLGLGVELIPIVPQDNRLALQVLRTLVREKRGAEAGALMIRWLDAGGRPSQGTLLGLISSLRRDAAFVAALEPAATERAEASADPELWVQLAILRLGIERPLLAWAAMQRAEALGAADARSARRHPFAGRLLSDHPEPAGGAGAGVGSGLDALERAVATHPTHLGLALRHARALELDGRAEDAEAAYRALAERAPALAVVALRAAMGSLESGAPDQALAILRELVLSKPRSRLAHALMVRSAHAAGAAELVEAALTKLSRLGTPTPGSRELLKLVDAERLAPLLEPIAPDAPPRERSLRLAWQALALSVIGRHEEAAKSAVLAQAAGMVGPEGAVAPILLQIASPD